MSGSEYDTPGVRLSAFLWGTAFGMLVMLGVYQFVLAPRFEAMAREVTEMERKATHIEREIAAVKAGCRASALCPHQVWDDKASDAHLP